MRREVMMQKKFKHGHGYKYYGQEAETLRQAAV